MSTPEPLPIAFERASAENEGEPVAELVRRLRAHQAGYGDAEPTLYTEELCAEAASTIERLQRELDEARAEKAERREFWEAHRDHFDVAGNYIPHSQLDGDLRAAEASLVRAREALKPFAEFAEVMPGAADDYQITSVHMPPHRPSITMRDLRAARAILGDAP